MYPVAGGDERQQVTPASAQVLAGRTLHAEDMEVADGPQA
jgi:hypothetical protein